MRGRVSDLVGRRFGRWTVIARTVSARAGSHWRCRCDCGAEGVVRGTNLVQGLSRGCRAHAPERREGPPPKDEHLITILRAVAAEYEIAAPPRRQLLLDAADRIEQQAAALRQSSEEGERRGREEAAKVADAQAAEMAQREETCRANDDIDSAVRCAVSTNRARHIAAAIRSLNSPTPTNVPNETDR